MDNIEEDNKSSFSPGILLRNGETFTPPNWMWQLAFALRGVDWAIEAIMKDENAFRQGVLDYYRDNRIEQLGENIRHMEEELIRVRAIKKELESEKEELENQ